MLLSLPTTFRTFLSPEVPLFPHAIHGEMDESCYETGLSLPNHLRRVVRPWGSRRISFSRAEHRVRIAPTQLGPGETAIDIGPTQWTLQGYDLRGLLARVFDVEPTRVDLGVP